MTRTYITRYNAKKEARTDVVVSMSYVAPLPVEAAGEIKYEDAVRLAVAGANGDETKLAKLKKTLDRAKFMREIAKENILHEAVYGDDSNGYKKTFDARYGEIKRQRELRGELLKKYVPNPVVYFDRVRYAISRKRDTGSRRR